MRGVRLLRKASRLVGLLIAASQLGCSFEPDIAPLDMATVPPGPFSGTEAESPEAGIERLLDELFDPYNLPPGITYVGSVYWEADQVIAGAYAHYGHDLAQLAASGQDNPLTLEEIREYLEGEGLRWIEDPVTGEQFDVYAWLVSDLALDGPDPRHFTVLELIEGVDEHNPMNYERNYLAALFATHGRQVEQARWDLEDHLHEVYGEDAAAIYQYLLTLDLMGTADD